MEHEKRVLVTGGAGFIGSHLVDELDGAGADVLVVDNCVTGHESLVPDGVRLERVDVGDDRPAGRGRRLAAVGGLPLQPEKTATDSPPPGAEPAVGPGLCAAHGPASR